MPLQELKPPIFQCYVIQIYQLVTKINKAANNFIHYSYP